MVRPDLSLLCAGDAFISRRLSVLTDEKLSSLINIIRCVDVAFVNLETTVHRFEGYPIGEGKTDAYAQAEPYVADELKWAGFDLVSRANNHSMDYSVEGMAATTINLERVGLIHAGAGMNLEEAREPAYHETPKGIVSLVSASTYNLGVASYTRSNLRGRPGINPLRLETVYNLDPDSFKALREVANKFGVGLPRGSEEIKEFTFPTREGRFKLAEETKVVRTVNELDFKGNIKAVEDARRLSDWVVFSLHDHASASKVPEGFKPRDFAPEPIEEFAHACIDAGADAFVGHGPHVLRGIELYKGKPIFYSLGNFVFQSTLITRQPSDLFERWGLGKEASTADLYEKREAPPAHFFDEPDYWQSIIAEVIYKDKKLEQLKLHPITLDYDATRPLKEQRTKAGIPRLADETLGRKIIEHLNRLSARYGTEIECKAGVGIVQL